MLNVIMLSVIMLNDVTPNQHSMDKLKLREQNLGRAFNFKCGRVHLYLEIALITKMA